MTKIKFPIPGFLLSQGVSQATYSKWLNAKASAHVRRDRKRLKGFSETASDYREAIHDAVCRSQGVDYFTHLPLDWGLIGKWRNENASLDGMSEKIKFKDLPTVDHLSRVAGKDRFVICSWRVNDIKGDLEYDELVELCRLLIQIYDEENPEDRY